MTPLPPPTPHTWHNNTELFWLTASMLHVSLLPSQARAREIKGRLGKAIKAAKDLWGSLTATLRGTGGALGHPQAQGILANWMNVAGDLDGMFASILTSQVWIGLDKEKKKGVLNEAIPFLRLQAVFALRCISPEGFKLVPGLCEEGEHYLDGGGSSSNSTTPMVVATLGGASSPPPSAAAAGVAPPPLPPPHALLSSPSPSARSAGSAGGGGGGGGRPSPLLGPSGSPPPPPPSQFLPIPAPQLPLPPPHPLTASLPAWIIKDVAELLTNVNQSHQRSLPFTMADTEKSLFHDLLTFFTVLLDSPLHVVNPYGRGALSNAADIFIPHPEDPWRDPTGLSGGLGGGRKQHPEERRQHTPTLHTIVGSHDIAIKFLTPGLANFYVDINTAGSHTGECAGALFFSSTPVSPLQPLPFLIPSNPPPLSPSFFPRAQCSMTSSTSGAALPVTCATCGTCTPPTAPP